MKSWNNLYADICSFENLWQAARAAERGKRMEDAVGRFCNQREAEVCRLRTVLVEKTWRPGSYRTWMITRPKERMISAAPFRDRVVHHALCQVVMPLLERKMIFDLYSNREGKGTHAAIQRAQEYSRQYRFALKCDIKKFFPSMDHEILKERLHESIVCADTRWLLDKVIDGSNPQEPVCAVFPGDDLAAAGLRRVGLPIGNLTSQWFGCVYLSEFDHWVKETLRCPGYIRYVDDFVLFGDDKDELGMWRAALREKLHKYRLHLNEAKSRIYQSAQGITFLGQRVWPGQRRLIRSNVVAARRRLRWQAREVNAGRLDRDAFYTRWQSWRGHAVQADGLALVTRVRDELRAVLGADGNQVNVCCGAARGITTRPTCGARTATTTHRAMPRTTLASGASGGFGV